MSFVHEYNKSNRKYAKRNEFTWHSKILTNRLWFICLFRFISSEKFALYHTKHYFISREKNASYCVKNTHKIGAKTFASYHTKHRFISDHTFASNLNYFTHMAIFADYRGTFLDICQITLLDMIIIFEYIQSV